MGIRSGSHLRQRGDVWHYRRPVPPDCRDAYGKVEETHSLGTRSETEAKRLEKRSDTEFEERIRAIREANDPDKRQRRAAAVYMERVPPVRPPVIMDMQSGGIGLGGYLHSDAVRSDDMAGVAEHVVQSLADRSASQSRLVGLLREIADIVIGVGDDAWERCRVDLLGVARHHGDSARAEPLTVIKTTAPTPGGFCAFRTIFEKWQNQQKPTPKTIYSWKKIIAKLVAHLHGKDKADEAELMIWNAASLTEADLIAWKDKLVLSIGPTTIKNHFTILMTIYNFAADNILVDRSIADAVRRVKAAYKARKRRGTKRLGYTDDDARLILTAARCESDPVLRWSPWVAAAIGCRIDEVCGAMVADIAVDSTGLAWFSIMLDNRDDDPDQDAEIKSDNAERTVPIHPALWNDEGLGKYVASLPENGSLFPKLKPDRFGRRGGNGSKRVQRWIRGTKVGITDPRKAPSHSWRHRYRSIVRNPKWGIGEDVADYMCGHGGEGGEGRNYGEYEDAMRAAIAVLPPPEPSIPSHPAPVAAER